MEQSTNLQEAGYGVFLGGLEINIKNLVKMFEPKSLKQAYNLARLHNNTLTYRKVTPHYPKLQG